MSLLSGMRLQKQQQRRAEVSKALLHYEARIGGELFGPIAKGARREFFCLDRHTWVWHEESSNAAGKRHVMTTRYDIRPQGIFKSQSGQAYRKISGSEARHFIQATSLYLQRVRASYDKLAQ